jgi:DUF2971 family protein
MADDRITFSPPDPERPTPSCLYKYKRFGSDAERNQLRSILIDHKLFFSSRTKFNDPFDCLVPSFKDVPRHLIKKFIQRRSREIGIASDRNEARRFYQNFNLDKFQEDLQTEVNKIGILCLTEDPLDMLMWGHYADAHTGVCLQFSVSPTDPFFGRAQPVTYSIKRPKFDPDRSYQENAEAAILTKSIDWMYEHEWRILELSTGPATYRFPTDKLTGLILGYRMERKARDEVLELVAEGTPGLRIYESLPNDREYKMRLNLLD